MNKSDKLRLYGQKDYTELIEFPVELVGKDGVVRRYTYEESLLVYAKRIESAFQRYRDRDLAAAEVDHCHKRIEQIKRSWKAVSARKIESSADHAARYEETAAAECRGFIREYFGRALAERVATDEEPIPIYLALVQHTGPLKVFHVSLANRKGGHLLYAFAFGWEPDTEGVTDARSQYADWNRILASAPGAGEDVERLLAAREGKDFGFLLTASQAAAAPAAMDDVVEGPSAAGGGARRAKKKAGANARVRVQALLDEDPTNAEAHYAMGILLAGEGDDPAAMEELKLCVELQPWYREAYRSLASIGDALGLHEEVEPYLLQARHYFPEDGGIQHQLALVTARLGRRDEALEAARVAVSLDPNNHEAADLLRELENARRKNRGADFALAAVDRSREMRDLAAGATGRPGPSRLVIALVALALAGCQAVHALEPMAGAFALALVLVFVILARARAADPA